MRKVAELGGYALEIWIGREVPCPVGILDLFIILAIFIVGPKVVLHYIILDVVFKSVSLDSLHVVLDGAPSELIVASF